MEPGPTRQLTDLTPADDWESVIGYDPLSLLQPGDEATLHEGTYMQPASNFKLRMCHQETGAQPIVIHAAEGESVVLTRPNASQNVINIMGARHLIIRGLEITGGSAGIRIGSTPRLNYAERSRFPNRLAHSVLAANAGKMVPDIFVAIRRTAGQANTAFRQVHDN